MFVVVVITKMSNKLNEEREDLIVELQYRAPMYVLYVRRYVFRLQLNIHKSLSFDSID